MNSKEDILKIDCQAETDRIASFIQQQMKVLRRKGAIIGLSGGIDSALCAALCVKALGVDKVYGLILPERESSPKSEIFAKEHAEQLGIEAKTIDITKVLEAIGTYKLRDDIIMSLVPEYTSSAKYKLSLPGNILDSSALNFYNLIVDLGEGGTKNVRLRKEHLLGILSATSTKQRTRMIHLYLFAERMEYLVCGTTNKSELTQGFFVKHGDGGVDIEPLAHLYKAQVYQLSEHLNVIEEIRNRAPSPDTYSYEVSDEDFYFRLPYEKLDLLMHAWEKNIPLKIINEIFPLSEAQWTRVVNDFATKFQATKHLRELPPSLL